MNISYCQETIKFLGNGITGTELFARFVWHRFYEQKINNLFSGLSDIHLGPCVLPLGREKVDLPKGRCLRRPVSAGEP